MSNYTKATDFAAKDSLPSGDAAKVIKGAEFEDEFDAIATAVNSKADTASPTFTGTVTIPTASVTTFNLGGTEVTATATELNYVDGVTSAIQTQIDTKAPIASPTFTGTVTVPGLTTTANIAFGDNDKATFGDNDDLQIYHDGVHSYVEDIGTGDLYFKTNGNGFFFKNPSDLNFISALTANNTVRLHHGNDGSIKLSTSSNGVEVFGQISLGAWDIKVVANELVFEYNGTDVFKLGTNGAVTSADNVTAYGTI